MPVFTLIQKPDTISTFMNIAQRQALGSLGDSSAGGADGVAEVFTLEKKMVMGCAMMFIVSY